MVTGGVREEKGSSHSGIMAGFSAPVSEESDLDWDYTKKLREEEEENTSSSFMARQIADKTAAYFLWPTISRPHGSAEEREDYFKGLQKDPNFKLYDSPPCGQQASTLLDLMTIRAYNSLLLRKVSLGTAVGFRTRKGELTDIPAIIVFVARKVHKVWLNENERLPTYLEVM
jgi:hypothetical protein